MKIVWLCSWFPNELDRYGGDFIERHARALAIHHPLDIIHVVQNPDLLQREKNRRYETKSSNIRVLIRIIPFRFRVNRFISQILFNRTYHKALKRTIDDYIRDHGKPDLVHVHVPVKIGWGALYMKKKYQIPFVVTEHNSAYFLNIPHNYQTNNFYFKYITRNTFQKARAASTVSQWLMDQLSHLFQLQAARVIRNTVNTDLFYYQPQAVASQRFIHVSMMDELKNVKGIIQAFIHLNKYRADWELVLVGPASVELRQLAEQGGIAEKISWTGLIPYDEVAAQMRQAQVLVHFSQYENLPCVVSEALCCGLAVIASDVGGIHELVNTENGMLVPPGNTDQLAAALGNYLNDPARYDRKSMARKASEQFNYSAIGKVMLDWYKEVLGIV